MDGADTLLTGLASGDRAPADAVVPEASMKRDQDSVDDFEHLEGEGKKDDISDSPLHSARNTTQSFLDMERDVFLDTPRAPSVTEKLEHMADKFTDSESDAGESPMHRPVPAKARDTVPEAAAPTDPTPVLTPATVTIPVPSQEKKEPEPTLISDVAPIINEVKSEFKPMTSPDVFMKPSESKTETISTAVEPKPAPAQPASAPAPVVTVKPKPEAPRGHTAHIIEAEVIFCQMGLDAWFDPQRLHPEVEALVYWRNAARSGAALGAGLVLLVALACCSVVSVFAYCSLLALSAAVAFRIYKNVLQAVQKTNEGHPFKWLLERDVSVSAERAQALAASATAHLNAALHELRRLFLVEDLVDSLKFGVLLWCLTYLGACFNGITLVILGWIALFTLPKAYEMNKAQVDANLELARAKINEITAKVRAAVPLGRKTESDKEK